MRPTWTLIGALVLLAAAPAAAATLTVTTTVDSADGACDAHCSLREAVLAANAAPGADTIDVPEGLFALVLVGADEDAGLTGDLDLTDDVTLIGMGTDRTVIASPGNDRVIDVRSATVTLADLTITGGGGVDDAAGISADVGSTLHLSYVAVIGNHARLYGGGVGSYGLLVAADCTFADNSSGQYYGAVLSFGSLQVVRSAFVGNRTLIGGGAVCSQGGSIEDSLFAGNAARGGGALWTKVASTALVNVTFSNNAGSTGNGAIYAESGSLSLRHVTLADNAGTPAGTALGLHSGVTVTAENTVVAGPGSWPGCAAGVSSDGHNLDATGGCGFAAAGDLSGGAAGLGALRANGGETLTRALLAGSPAIDAGGGGTAAADQRGTARPVGAAADIGAYEADGSEPPIGMPRLVPVVAHVAGVGGTPWRSDLALTNPTPDPMQVTLIYQPGEGAPLQVQQALGGWQTVLLEDVVAGILGQGDGRGGLQVVPPAAGPVPAVLSRTFAVAGGERLGQGMPALEMVPGRTTTYIVGLTEDEAYRGNVAVTAGEADLGVQVDLFRGSDGPVGSTFAQTVPAGTQMQWRLPAMFPGLSRPGVPMTARVRLFQPGIAYGSLVDQASTDAVTLVAQPPQHVWFVPVVAHNPGGAGTFWSSDLSLFNHNPVPATVSLEYLPENTDNGAGGQLVTVVVPAGATVALADVAGQRFGVANGKGLLRIVSAPPLVVASRTYTTRSGGGTYGLGVEALPSWAPSASRKVVPGVRVGGGYRTNLGFAAVAAAVTLDLTLRDAAGAVLDTASLAVPARSLVQKSVEDLFDVARNGFTTGSVEVAASRQPVIVYTSVVDGTSQDPIYAVAPVVD